MYELPGEGWIAKGRTHWRLVVPLKTPSGERFFKTRTTDIKCAAKSSQGRKAATRELQKFREELIATYHIGQDLSSIEREEQRAANLVEAISSFIALKVTTGTIVPRTAEGYEMSLKHIKVGLGDESIGSLTPHKVEAWISDAVNRGVSLDCIKRAFKLLKSYYAYLLSFPNPIVDGNPCAPVMAPKVYKKPPNSLLRDLIPRLNGWLDGLEDSPIKRATTMSLHTGVRVGEVCDLKWSDIDWDQSYLVVRTAVSMHHGKLYSKVTKGEEQRLVPLDAFLSRYLKQLWEFDYALLKLIYPGEVTCRRELMRRRIVSCHTLDHGADWIYSPKRITKRFTAAAREHGFIGTTGELITFHGLRHTFATQWIAAGGDIRALSDILGHKSVSFTLDVYVSSDATAKWNGIVRVSDVLSMGCEDAPASYQVETKIASKLSIAVDVPLLVWRRASELARDEGIDAETMLLRCITQYRSISSRRDPRADPALSQGR